MLSGGHKVVTACLTDPVIVVGMVTGVTGSAVGSPPTSDLLTVNMAATPPTAFSPGQWVLLDGFRTATFLNGLLAQVLASPAPTPTQFTAALPYASSFDIADTGLATPVGSSLLAMELDENDALVPGSAEILASSPTRTGNTYGSVSLVCEDGANVELYYEEHPKLLNFADQTFQLNRFDRGTSPPAAWARPAQLTTFQGRYTDDRLTAIAGPAPGERLLSQGYWSQQNHPLGIVGNVMIGYNSGATSWAFHPTLGSQSGGSIVQGALSVSQSGLVSLTYLLQPFDVDTAAWPLKVSSLDLTTLGLTDVPGYYNNVSFTWLRGTKSLIDDTSAWALVGEMEVLSPTSETHTIPPATLPPPPFTVLVGNSSAYFNDLGVTYVGSGLPLALVATGPAAGAVHHRAQRRALHLQPGGTGLAVTISYSYISAVVPVYASLFNVPPVVVMVPPEIWVWRGASFYSLTGPTGRTWPGRRRSTPPTPPTPTMTPCPTSGRTTAPARTFSSTPTAHLDPDGRPRLRPVRRHVLGRRGRG